MTRIERMIRNPAPCLFQAGLRHLDRLFCIYAATSPQPLPAPGLVISPEIRLQSELYLPIKDIRRLFNRLYGATLSYAPILSSTPFHHCPSWADCYAGLPPWLQFSANPACLLERLLGDRQLLVRFLFYSFLPNRFNGAGFGRYPAQLDWLRQHLAAWSGSLRVLDAACGSGEGTWELAALLQESGRPPERSWIEGWTLDPLEAWAAENRRLPHIPKREQIYRQRTQSLLEQGWKPRVSFKVQDLLEESAADQQFDLIRCNGLLGGPIIPAPDQIRLALGQLVKLLMPGGTLLLANRFHDGWRKQAPQDLLIRLLHDSGLKVLPAGEGLAGFL